MKIPVGRIPKYITSGSPKGLRRSMLKVQAQLGYGVKWFDIQKDGKKFIAWYYDNEDITLHNIEEKVNGELGEGNE